jgi:hypothetical protein
MPDNHRATVAALVALALLGVGCIVGMWLWGGAL